MVRYSSRTSGQITYFYLYLGVGPSTPGSFVHNSGMATVLETCAGKSGRGVCDFDGNAAVCVFQLLAWRIEFVTKVCGEEAISILGA